VGVHRAWEHALEFEALDIYVQAVRIRLDFSDRPEVALARGQLKQLARIGDAARQPIEAADNVFQLGALPSQFLRALGLVPDAGLLQFARDFLQAFMLIVVIKDTPLKSRCAPRVL
jgi:hypothetical protein